MIPQVIHYCWFGRNPLPEEAVKCIESWKKFFPGYEIKEWNEDNFDVNKTIYTKEAYASKKYAFVSDCARFDILYHEGGLYFDTDVEVIKSFEPILANGAFMGCERDGEKIAVAPGLGIAAEKGNHIYKELLDNYAKMRFINDDGIQNITTVVEYTTDILKKHGLQSITGIQKVNDITIYPKEYFAPKDLEKMNLEITPNTYSIHHYDGSWLTGKNKKWHKICSRMEKLCWITRVISHSFIWQKIIATIYKTGFSGLYNVILCKLMR